MSITITLPWPARALWQNTRSHWASKAAARRTARREAFYVALEAGVREIQTQRPLLRFHFHAPDARKRDLSNMPATQKAAIDGIADAMGCDDAGFLCAWPMEWAEPVEGGAVVIQISDPEKPIEGPSQ